MLCDVAPSQFWAIMRSEGNRSIVSCVAIDTPFGSCEREQVSGRWRRWV
jgi:hypothetical protein